MAVPVIARAIAYTRRMARWEPNARERLQAAAFELFEERGYDGTTVGDIAARADLTDRTFFRYFADKREVLFSGSEELEKLIAAAIASAPKTMSPLDVVVAALAASSPAFEARRAIARTRQALIELRRLTAETGTATRDNKGARSGGAKSPERRRRDS